MSHSVSTTPAAAGFRWQCSGDAAFADKLSAIAAARSRIRFEMYIYTAGELGTKFRAALIDACTRGVQVEVLLDSLGSTSLSDSFWKPLRDAGGMVRWFNPLRFRRIAIRNHRKLLVCDDQVAFVGGRNISEEYEGDGVERGWCDLGMELHGPVVTPLAESFDRMFARAEFQQRLFARMRKAVEMDAPAGPDGVRALFGRPGRNASPLKASLTSDLARARDVRIVSAYFLPPLRLRRLLARVARRGGRVQLITAGKSDVALAQLAAQNLYQRLLRARVEIAEYEPQILHAKLFIIDDTVYVGSANLDIRSLHINYELLVRLKQPSLVEEAHAIFEHMRSHSRRIDPGEWSSSRSLWRKFRERCAGVVLARLDPYFARWVTPSAK